MQLLAIILNGSLAHAFAFRRVAITERFSGLSFAHCDA